MKIERVYNNNVVSAFHDGKEYVYMGKGLGFQKKAGDNLDETAIEKRFVLDDVNGSSELSRIHVTIDSATLSSVLKIIEMAEEELGRPFEANFYIALADHLQFAIERSQEGLIIENPLTWEVRKFYPREFQLAQKAVDLLNQDFGILLPKEEVANIALHFLNGQKDLGLNGQGRTLQRIVVEIMDIVRLDLGLPLSSDEESLVYDRFRTHLHYFAQRVIKGGNPQEGDSFLYEQIALNYPQAFATTQKIVQYVDTNFAQKVSRDEQVYLTIHINKLQESIKEKKG
ncbi:PRD domain-containing protein [Streptococcus sp. DD12]|uniref:PRD domain-containing protein n=1 Tax=Streptococcus sp. DD12 TaxID=1777880 RepID=UPI0007931D45|nr:PRD domain-containing protein [Streptococcus sp. DD12]KXT76549.1 Beta-glucoside bgl operon antiterminator, BglG family [Streptococcus sp. DD12]